MFYLTKTFLNWHDVKGLRVAYLSGVQADDPLTAKPFNYTIANVQSLEVSITCRYRYRCRYLSYSKVSDPHFPLLDPDPATV